MNPLRLLNYVPERTLKWTNYENNEFLLNNFGFSKNNLNKKIVFFLGFFKKAFFS